MSLSITNLTKAFGEKTLFSNFNYTFEDKGLYLIVGDSGIGKTTLLRMISGLDKNYLGLIEGGGQKNVSFAFQEYRLFPKLTAIENVTEAVYETIDESSVNEAKKMLFYLGFSQGDFNLLPSELSGGMKQRVSLARAFLKKSLILILDEPTKELDEDLCGKVRELILNESKRRLILVVTHNESHLVGLEYTTINLNLFR